MDYITIEPPDPEDTVRAQRLPFVACEVICTWPIYERILDDEELLMCVLKPLKQESVNLLLLGYITRIIRSFSGSSHSSRLITYLFESEGYIYQLLHHFYSFSTAELLINLITTGDTYHLEKKSVVIRLLACVQSFPTPIQRYHCAKAVLELLEQAESYQNAKELSKAVITPEVLATLVSTLQSVQLDTCLYGLQILKSITKGQLMRSIVQAGEQDFGDVLCKVVEALGNLMTENENLPAECLSNVMGLVASIAKLNISIVLAAVTTHNILTLCTSLFLSREFPSLISTQYMKLVECICSLPELYTHYIHSTAIQSLILQTIQDPMVSL